MNIGCYLAALVALADQGSKWWIMNKVLFETKALQINEYLNFVLSWNNGVTFGIFNKSHQLMPYVFIGAAVVIILFLLNWLMRAESLTTSIGLGLVMGGAIGNVIDRFRYGAVMDFIDFHYTSYHWYAFNLADSAIVLGVFLLMTENLASAMKVR